MTTATARALRRRPTDAERHMWALLRGRRLAGYKFRRQHPVGRFIVDFACIARRVIIELDGDAHARQADADAQRTEVLQRHGYRVLRFSNREVLTAGPAVQEAVLRVLGGLPAESG